MLTVFRNCRVWDGTREAPSDGSDVLVEGDIIKEVADRPIKIGGAREVQVGGRVLMPGLIDAHVHACVNQVSFRSLAEVPPTLMAIEAAKELNSMVNRGFTTVRDCGGADWGLAEAVKKGHVQGPRIFHSGRGLSQTGGHGDYRQRTEIRVEPCGCSHALSHVVRIADGVTEVRKAARDELRQGATQIKVMVSGGLSSPYDPIENIQFSEEELVAIVQEAKAWHTYVAGHAHTSDAVRHALKCGVRSIEHATLIDLETAREIMLAGAFVVPTIPIFDALVRRGAAYGLSESVKEQIAEIQKHAMNALQMCMEAGVNIGMGSDLLGPLRDEQSRALIFQAEVQGVVGALKSATLVNADLIGQSGKLGVVTEGAYADLLVVEGDPTKTLSMFENCDEGILLIMKAGKIIRSNF